MTITQALRLFPCSSLLFVVAACGAPAKEAAINQPPAAAGAPAASADARADLVTAMRSSLAAKSYRVRRTTESSDGRKRSMTAEVVMPDRMRMTTEMESPTRGKLTREVISMGNTSFVRVGQKPWQKDPMGMGNLMLQLSDPKAADEVAKSAGVKYLGTDSLDGEPMLLYQYTIKNLMGPGHDGVSKIWIGANDHMQHQVETETDFDPLNTGKMIHNKSTTKFYDYNADIKIEAPM